MIEVCAIHITYLQAFAICTITNKKQQQNNDDSNTYTTKIPAHTSNF